MISIIIPVYNEDDAILNTIRAISKIFDGFVTYEIIVVNDGSTDKTLNRLEGSSIKNFTLINHVENIGYGKSLFDGIVVAKYNCIAIIDADGSYPAASLRELYQYYPQYDMVVGARKGKEYKGGFLKRPARLLFQYLVEYATGRKVKDVNSGLRIFKKDVVLKFQDSLCVGFSFTTTITLFFLLNHYFVKYLPIEYMKRKGTSKVRHFRDTLRAGQIIVEAILLYNPIKLFLLIAVFNSLFGIFFGIFNHFVLRSNLFSIVSGICIASFIPIFSLGLMANQLTKIYKLKKLNYEKAKNSL